MKVFTLSFEILVLIFSLSTQITNGNQPDYCEYIQYDKPDVNDKPKLIIEGKFIKTSEPKNEPDVYKIFKFSSRVCHMEEDDSKAKSVTSSSNPCFHKFIQYDPMEHSIYGLSHERNLVGISLVDNKKSVVYKLSENFSGKISNTFALDWNTKNLYVLIDGYLMLLNSKYPSKYLSHLSDIKFARKYFNLRIFPNEGYLVVATKSHIIRLRLDGSKPQVLYSCTNKVIGDVALDYHKQDIYFSESHPDNEMNLKIRYVNLYGGEVKKFVIKNGPKRPFLSWKHLAVDESYIYWSYYESSSQYFVRARKDTGIYDEDFKVRMKLGDDLDAASFVNILVLNGAKLEKEKCQDNPCRVNNGGCEDFCLAVPDKNRKLYKKCLDSEPEQIEDYLNDE